MMSLINATSRNALLPLSSFCVAVALTSSDCQFRSECRWFQMLFADLCLKHTDPGFRLFTQKKQSRQGSRERKKITKGHSAFCLSSFPCRLAYCALGSYSTHAWLAVSARAMRRIGCNDCRQASTGHQSVDTN